MTDTLSQAEIDAMMNGSFDEPATNVAEETHIPEAPKPIIDTTDENTRFDLLGEVGNISMSQAATTLSSILNRRVNITTPQVKKCHFSEVMGNLTTPKVATIVEFKEGLLGSNLMVLDVNDANIIADLMMGGAGTPASMEFTDLQLSAVAEAMNQMIGSASTSMSTMIERKVDILPPKVRMWNTPQSIDYDDIDADEDVYRIAFKLSVEGLIESEIMQIFSSEVVDGIEKAMLGMTEAPSTVATTATIDGAVPTTPQQAEAVNVAATANQAAAQVSHPQFQPLADTTVKTGDNLDLILDVPLNLSVVLGRSQKKIRDILSLNVGSVVELDNLTDEPLDILLNGKLIAQGEVVVINENFGIRITNILTMSQRLQSLNK